MAPAAKAYCTKNSPNMRRPKCSRAPQKARVRPLCSKTETHGVQLVLLQTLRLRQGKRLSSLVVYYGCTDDEVGYKFWGAVVLRTHEPHGSSVCFDLCERSEKFQIVDWCCRDPVRGEPGFHGNGWIDEPLRSELLAKSQQRRAAELAARGDAATASTAAAPQSELVGHKRCRVEVEQGIQSAPATDSLQPRRCVVDAHGGAAGAHAGEQGGRACEEKGARARAPPCAPARASR